MNENGPVVILSSILLTIIVIAIWAVAVISYCIYQSITLSKIFAKAGVEGWKAWIPFYNEWVFLRLGRQPGWPAFLAPFPFINVIWFSFNIMAAHSISQGFRKDIAYTFVYIFLRPIWLGVLAFNKEPFDPSLIVDPYEMEAARVRAINEAKADALANTTTQP